MTIPLLPGNPPELVVYDKPGRCPYLAGRVAHLPLRLPVLPLTRKQLDEHLGEGDRRQGFVLYRTACATCQACEPIRIDVPLFQPNRAQRRIRRRGQDNFRVELGPAFCDEKRVALYNLHKRARGLTDGQAPIDARGYADFLVSTCCESFELRYWVGSELAGVAITDRAEDSLSAVYCYYDPRFERLSPGAFSILEQIQLCRRWGLRYLYLGLYIAECSAMQYKAHYLPHERLLDGRWVRFERPFTSRGAQEHA